MPGWHEATARLRQQDKLRTAGIVLEQHAERTRLFMQWKQLDWPVVVEPFNLLGLTAVPRTFLLDEHGVVRLIHPKLDELDRVEREFIDVTWAAAGEAAPAYDLRPQLEATLPAEDDALGWRERAMALALWGGEQRLDAAVEAAQRALALSPDDRTHFTAGVIRRMRFDSGGRREGDFRAAVEHWAAALDAGPNNYIWRRRLQQYGPRLDKPYPFYDWVPVAREEIGARGEEPSVLRVEPGGAEYAEPAQEFVIEGAGDRDPDPEGRIDRDEQPLVHIETALVPPAAIPGDSIRVHVVLRPNEEAQGHWNNEAGPTQLWVEPPAGWEVGRRLLEVPNPPDDISVEPRAFEFELRCPAAAAASTATLRAYALYFVCEDVTGVCLYRRQDLELPVTVRAADAVRLGDRRSS